MIFGLLDENSMIQKVQLQCDWWCNNGIGAILAGRYIRSFKKYKLMLIDKGIVLDGWITNKIFIQTLYWGDIFYQGMNLQSVELSLISSIEHG